MTDGPTETPPTAWPELPPGFEFALDSTPLLPTRGCDMCSGDPAGCSFCSGDSAIDILRDRGGEGVMDATSVLADARSRLAPPDPDTQEPDPT